MNKQTSPTWKLTSPTALLTALLVAFMIFLAINGLRDPAAAAKGFGVPLADAGTIPWLYIKAGRDVGIGLALLGVLLARERRAAGLMVLGFMVSPMFDATVVMRTGGSVAYALAVHGSAVLYGLLLGPALLLGARGRRAVGAPEAENAGRVGVSA